MKDGSCEDHSGPFRCVWRTWVPWEGPSVLLSLLQQGDPSSEGSVEPRGPCTQGAGDAVLGTDFQNGNGERIDYR